MTTLSDIHNIAAYCPYRFSAPNDDDGLVGIGADLTAPTLLHAYLSGIFPWSSYEDSPTWWCPNPRCVFETASFSPSKSLKRTAKKRTDWWLSVNLAFDEVIKACSEPRAKETETWISQEMQDSYGQLHRLGVGFSVEVWAGKPYGELAGGLYGLKIGAGVFGESMFHRQTDASKLAFWALNKLCVASHIPLIDCQLPNDYLLGLGADIISRDEFLAYLKKAVGLDSPMAQTASDWQKMSFIKPLSWLYE